jgi:hypothetical protein
MCVWSRTVGQVLDGNEETGGYRQEVIMGSCTQIIGTAAASVT